MSLPVDVNYYLTTLHPRLRLCQEKSPFIAFHLHIVCSLVLSWECSTMESSTKYITILQRLQNWSAKLIFQGSKRDHASQNLQDL